MRAAADEQDLDAEALPELGLPEALPLQRGGQWDVVEAEAVGEIETMAMGGEPAP